MTEKTERLVTYLPRDDMDKLRAIAKTCRQNPSSISRIMITKALDEGFTV